MAIGFISNANGRLVQRHSCGLKALSSVGNILLDPSESASANTHYALQGAIEQRPECFATLTGTLISGIPLDRLEEATVTVEGIEYPIPAGESEAEIVIDQPGSYTVLLKCFPYLDKEFTIEGQA